MAVSAVKAVKVCKFGYAQGLVLQSRSGWWKLEECIVLEKHTCTLEEKSKGLGVNNEGMERRGVFMRLERKLGCRSAESSFNEGEGEILKAESRIMGTDKTKLCSIS